MLIQRTIDDVVEGMRARSIRFGETITRSPIDHPTFLGGGEGMVVVA